MIDYIHGITQIWTFENNHTCEGQGDLTEWWAGHKKSQGIPIFFHGFLPGAVTLPPCESISSPVKPRCKSDQYDSLSRDLRSLPESVDCRARPHPTPVKSRSWRAGPTTSVGFQKLAGHSDAHPEWRAAGPSAGPFRLRHSTYWTGSEGCFPGPLVLWSGRSLIFWLFQEMMSWSGRATDPRAFFTPQSGFSSKGLEHPGVDTVSNSHWNFIPYWGVLILWAVNSGFKEMKPIQVILPPKCKPVIVATEV